MRWKAAVLVALLLLTSCAVAHAPNSLAGLKRQAEVERIMAIKRCVLDDVARHWPKVVYYKDGTPPHCL
ncbi:MAG: hypothetical protein CMN57_11975 [Gammaproteobacteria bacterium]|jgi:hypothetical protein|nr:hypothetical protein [Gammaproteobacteria bacterium]|tara:strand:+ start:26753 stop:26959 length:207 start_codon:yes stop_codon:yes gene_type:complete